MHPVTVVAKLADPLMFAAAALLVWLTGARRWWHLLLVGFAVACLPETLLTSMQSTRVWGETLPAGVLAYSIDAALASWAIRWWRRRRAARAAA